ncbi:MAG: HpcH/HpaI aldolase/citrate lyase family protein [Chloroflexota bacterium]
MANIRPNRIKQKLAAGEIVTILAGAGDADTIDSWGPIGADGIWLEGEHGPVDFGDIADLTRACDLWGMTSILRLHQNEYGVIYRALDRGVQGVVIPHVNNKAEAENVVNAAKFAPIGKRGLFVSRQGYGVPDYVKVANDHTLLIILIEDIAAIEKLDEILSVDHIDVFFVAPSDLAASMGHIGDIGHPDVRAALDGALKKIVAAGKTAGTLATSENVEHYAALGVKCFMTGVQPWIAAGAKDYMAKAAAAAKK